MSNSFATPSATRPGTAGRIALWVGRVLVALLFLMTGFAKLLGAQQMVTGFDAIGLGQWFRLFTGALEVIGAVLLVWPATSVLGAVIVIGIGVGAFFVQLFRMHGDVIHTIVLAAAGVALFWPQRNGLSALLRRA